MIPVIRSLLIALCLVALTPAFAHADTCSASVTIGGKRATLANCAVALYDSRSVTLFFTEKPLSDEERDAFEWNSYAKDRDPEGKPRTMIYFGFCAGVAGGAPNAANADFEVSVNHASSIMLQRQWVEKPKGPRLKIESLEGKLAPGGKLSGRFTGKPEADYSWDVSFEVTLPETEAAAGPGCGD